MEESNWKAGVAEGEAMFYNEEGMITEKGNYSKGERVGEWKKYDERGVLLP